MSQESDLNSLISSLKALSENKARKYLETILTTESEKIKNSILTPRTDQRLMFNADHILKERLAVLELIIKAPSISIKELEDRVFALHESQKPLEQRLQEYGDSFGIEAKKAGLIK